MKERWHEVASRSTSEPSNGGNVAKSRGIFALSKILLRKRSSKTRAKLANEVYNEP